jgi:hypothetical protein
VAAALLLVVAAVLAPADPVALAATGLLLTGYLLLLDPMRWPRVPAAVAVAAAIAAQAGAAAVPGFSAARAWPLALGVLAVGLVIALVAPVLAMDQDAGRGS